VGGGGRAGGGRAGRAANHPAAGGTAVAATLGGRAAAATLGGCGEGGHVSGTALVSALVVGLAIGVAGRWAVPGRRAPLWLTLAFGVAAALLGSIVARLAGADIDALPTLRLAVQTGCAAGAVLLALLTAGHRASTVPNASGAGRRR
jgi:hypothetical protein